MRIKPSFQLFGKDLRSPSEAAFLDVENTEVSEYRRELSITLAEAQELNGCRLNSDGTATVQVL